MGRLRRRRRGLAGGIDALLNLLDQQRGPLEYDFRSRFHLSLTVVGTDEMSFAEGLRLVQILRSDPSSMLASATEGWSHPLPRTDAVLMDLWDLTYAATGSKNREKYPRPFKTDRKRIQGDAGGRSAAEVMAILRPNGLNGAPV